MATKTQTRTAFVRNWADAVQIGSVRLKLRAVGSLIAWELVGFLNALSHSQRVEVAFTVWRRVRLNAGTVWDVYEELFPPLAGGLSRLPCGVAYVHRD